MQEGCLKRGWKQVAGSSGTVRSILEVQKALDPKATAITADGIENWPESTKDEVARHLIAQVAQALA